MAWLLFQKISKCIFFATEKLFINLGTSLNHFCFDFNQARWLSKNLKFFRPETSFQPSRRASGPRSGSGSVTTSGSRTWHRSTPEILDATCSSIPELSIWLQVLFILEICFRSTLAYAVTPFLITKPTFWHFSSKFWTTVEIWNPY